MTFLDLSEVDRPAVRTERPTAAPTAPRRSLIARLIAKANVEYCPVCGADGSTDRSAAAASAGRACVEDHSRLSRTR